MLKHKNIVFVFILLVSCWVGLQYYYTISLFYLVGLFFFWLGLTSWGAFDISLGYFIKAQCSKITSEKIIALTFDDGPHEYTEGVLDVLKKHQVKATFFCIGSQIEKYPTLFSRIIEEGHVVGNHTYSHTNSFGFLSTKKIIEEIQKTDAIILKESNKKPLLFRPPFGVTNPNITRALNETKHHVIGWNIRSLDTLKEDVDRVFNRVKNKIKPGGIVLMHDTSQKSVVVLEQLLQLLEQQQYKMVTVDKLLEISAYED